MFEKAKKFIAATKVKFANAAILAVAEFKVRYASMFDGHTWREVGWSFADGFREITFGVIAIAVWPFLFIGWPIHVIGFTILKWRRIPSVPFEKNANGKTIIRLTPKEK